MTVLNVKMLKLTNKKAAIIAAFLLTLYQCYLVFFLLNTKPISAEPKTSKVVGSGT
jgi:hypothetical protein